MPLQNAANFLDGLYDHVHLGIDRFFKNSTEIQSLLNDSLLKKLDKTV